jgi:hypothetical protein
MYSLEGSNALVLVHEIDIALESTSVELGFVSQTGLSHED